MIGNDKQGEFVKIALDGFTHLGLWTKVDAPIISIEPCNGISDFVDSNGRLKDKVGIKDLEPGKVFKCSYQIEIKENIN